MVQHAHIVDQQALASNGAQGRPVSSERRFWGIVGLFGLIGALVPLFVLGLPDRGYVATTSLKVEATSTTDVEAAIARLRSKASLDNLVRALNLSQASDFSASRPSVLGVFSDIVSGGGMTVSEAETELRNRILDATTITYAAGQLSIQARATANEEARRVAAMLAVMFSQQLAGVAETAVNPALTGMRQALERADAALSGFETQAGTDKLAEMRRFSVDAQRLGAEKDAAEAELQATQQKAAEAVAMKFVDVLRKPLPDSLEFTGLEYQRRRYVDAKLTLDQLSSDLGPRHPRFQAAQAAVDAVRKDIEDALKRLSTSLRQQETTATKAFADAKARADALTARQDIADGAVRLVALQAAADEARDNYLQAQGRTRQEPAAAARTNVIKPLATTAIGWSWFDYLPLVAGGAFVGGLVGLAANAAARQRPEQELEQLQAVEQSEPYLSGEETAAASLDENAQSRQYLEESDAFDIEPDAILDYETRHYDAKIYGIEAYDERGHDLAEDDDQQSESWNDVAAYDDDRLEGDLEFETEAEIDDRPLTDRINEILLANRRSADTSFLPPLLAAALAGDGRVEQRAANDSHLPEGNAEEFRELHRNMVELRERVQLLSERRTASRG